MPTAARVLPGLNMLYDAHAPATSLQFVDGQELLSALWNSSPLLHLSSCLHGLTSYFTGCPCGLVFGFVWGWFCGFCFLGCFFFLPRNIRGSLRPSRGKVGTFCLSTVHTPLPRSPCFEYISNSDTSPRRNQTGKSPVLRRTIEARPCAIGNGTSTKSCLRAIWREPIVSAAREKELDFFRLVDSTVVLPNIETTPQNTGAAGKPQASESSASSRQ